MALCSSERSFGHRPSFSRPPCSADASSATGSKGCSWRDGSCTFLTGPASRAVANDAMPTDLDLIVANLTSFHDFSGKIVIHVGAGGGQLLGYAAACRKVVAVDNDVPALERLEQRIAELALQKTPAPGACGLFDLQLPRDGVLFEFFLPPMR